MSEQKKVDDLFDQLSSEKATSPSPEATASAEADAPGVEETPAAAQKPVAPPAPSSPYNVVEAKRGVFGSQPEPKFRTIEEGLMDRIYQTEKRLRINEDLMLTYLFRKGINVTYYEMWRSDANKYFRNICTSKLRLERLRKNRAKAS